MSKLDVLASRKKSPTRLTRNSKIFKTIIHAIQEKKGNKIISLDLRKIPEAVADFFIICEATNPTQLKAIADSVEYEVKNTCGELPYKHEGRQQTSGKGQRGKSWISEKGTGILISFVVDTEEISMDQQFGLSIAAALSCTDLFHHLDQKEVKIKWPNDIYWGDRKAGGILIETIIHGSELKWAVVGIGININQENFDQSLTNAISLRGITGRSFNITILATELYTFFYKRIDYLKSAGIKSLIKEYNQQLYKLEQLTRLKIANELIETTINGVSSDGKLLTVAGEFNFGEVEWII